MPYNIHFTWKRVVVVLLISGLFPTTKISRVTLQLRAQNGEESSISPKARVWVAGGIAFWERGGTVSGQLRHALSDGVRPL